MKIDGRWRLAGEEDEPEPERIEPEPEDLSRWVIAAGAKARSSTARGTDSGQRSVWAVEKLWTTLCTILWAKVRRYADGRTKHILRKGPPRKGGPERNAPRSRREAAKWIRQVKSASKFPSEPQTAAQIVRSKEFNAGVSDDRLGCSPRYDTTTP